MFGVDILRDYFTIYDLLYFFGSTIFLLFCEKIKIFFFLVDRRNDKAIIKLTHTTGGIGVRIPVMTSSLTISTFCQLS